MLNRSCAEFRRGGTLTIVVLLLIPLLAMVAFAVDLGYVWRAEAELQTAADAAAHAGVSKLMSFAVRDIQPGLTKTGRLTLRTSATEEVRARAVAFGQMHKVADQDLFLLDEDIEVGYIADPAAPPDSLAGQFLTGVTALLFPNSVRVTVRRDATVPQGPLPLFFGPITGTPTVNRKATAVATLRGQNLVGFQGDGSKLLPVGLSLTSYLLLIGESLLPLNLLGDGCAHKTRTDGGLAPPANVTFGSDGIKEIVICPDLTGIGNYGLVSLTNSQVTSKNRYDNWIQNGPSAADLATFGPNGLRVLTNLYAPPNMDPVLCDFDKIIGQARVVPVLGLPLGFGSNKRYPVVGFTGVVVVRADSNSVVIQLSPVVDPTAALGGGAGGGGLISNPFIYQRISLSR